MRERTPSAPTTKRAWSWPVVPSSVRRATPVTRPLASVSVPVTDDAGAAPARPPRRRPEQDRVEHVAAGREQVVDPARSLTALDELRRPGVEGDRADRRGAAGDDRVEQAPAGELHDAAAGDGVGREGVARELGPVDDHDVEALAGEQHRGRGAAARAPTITTSCRSVELWRCGAKPCRHHPGPATFTLGEALKSAWRAVPSVTAPGPGRRSPHIAASALHPRCRCFRRTLPPMRDGSEIRFLQFGDGRVASGWPVHVIRQDDDRVRRLVDEHLGGEIEDWLRTKAV